MSFCRVFTSALVILGILAAWAGLVSRSLADEKENPLAARLKSVLKDPDRPFTLVIRLKIKDGAGEKFEAGFAKAAQATRQEKGNRAYQLNRDLQTPTQYILYERWQNLSALEAHLNTPIIKKLLAEIGEVQEGPPEMSVLVPVGD